MDAQALEDAAARAASALLDWAVPKAKRAAPEASAGEAPGGETPAQGRDLERRLGRLLAEREAERQRHAQEIAAVQRAADRRLAALVGELSSLRHHEARADALARLLAERDAELAAREERIAHLESLLQNPTRMG
jgi:hypothetical protein